MVKKDYLSYDFSDPQEVELFEIVFGNPSIRNEVKSFFESSRKGTILDPKTDKTYTSSTFQDFLKDRYGLNDSSASAICMYLKLTVIGGMKPRYAIQRVINKIRSQKGKISSTMS